MLRRNRKPQQGKKMLAQASRADYCKHASLFVMGIGFARIEPVKKEEWKAETMIAMYVANKHCIDLRWPHIAVIERLQNIRRRLDKHMTIDRYCVIRQTFVVKAAIPQYPNFHDRHTSATAGCPFRNSRSLSFAEHVV
jgi:hypothetical protein